MLGVKPAIYYNKVTMPKAFSSVECNMNGRCYKVQLMNRDDDEISTSPDYTAL